VYGSPPAEPAHSVYLGVVTKANASTGEIFVKVQNGYELNELHDVSVGSPSNGDIIQWNSTSEMWEKESLSTAGIAAASHAHSGVYDPAGTAASAITTHEAAADPHPTYLTATEGNAAYAATSHNHSTTNITSGNFVASVQGGTGVTSSVQSGNNAATTISIGQAVGTTNNVTFNNVTASGYLTSGNPYDAGNSNSSVSVSSVGITPLNTTIDVTVTPSFVGQKFLVAYHGSSTTNTSTVQYLIHSITDTSGSSLVQFRNFSNGSGVTFTNGFFGQAVWVADSTSAKTFQGRVRMQSSTGVTVTIYSYGMFFIPFP
jgi:hypothetical protein